MKIKKTTNIEIALEMLRIVGKGAKDFGLGLGIGTIMPLTLLTTIPSSIRYTMKSDFENNTLSSKMTYVGIYTSMLPSGLASMVGIFYLIGNNPKYLAIPLATNIASGFYELARKAKKNLEEKINGKNDEN